MHSRHAVVAHSVHVDQGRGGLTWCRRRPVLAELAEALAGPLVDTLSALEEAGAFLVTLSAEDVTGLPGGVPAPVLLAIAVTGCPGAPFATADFTPVTTAGRSRFSHSCKGAHW